MNDLRAVAQQALEAWDGGDTEWFKRAYTVMEALRAALAEPVQKIGVKLKPVFYAPRILDDEEVEDIIKRNAAITESILDIDRKEPQPGMVNLDAFRAFHFNDPPKGGFVGEIEMLKWLVRNRDGDYWKAKYGKHEPTCATQECMSSECPNCVSLKAQNTELDRKLKELERKPMNEFDALRLVTESIGHLKSAGPVEGLIGIIRAVERAHGIK